MLGRRFWIAVALGALASTTAGARADEASDLSGMFGAWTAKDPDGTESLWVFDGKNLKVTSPKRNYTTTLSIDTKANPRTIDFKVVKGPEDAQGKTALGIYKLGEGDDSLAICMGAKENVRPKEFQSVEGEAYLFKLKREKSGQPVAGGASRETQTQYDLTEMFGKWKAKDPDGAESHWVFDGPNLKITSPKRNYEITVTLDPTAKPRAIDFKVVKGPEDAEGKTEYGIYKFEAVNRQGVQRLIVCMAKKAEDRPKEFKAVKGEVFLYELERERGERARRRIGLAYRTAGERLFEALWDLEGPGPGRFRERMGLQRP